MQWAPSCPALARPKCLASLPGRSAKFGLASPGSSRSLVRTLRWAYTQKERAGLNSCGSCTSTDPAGYFSKMHFLLILEPPAVRLRMRSFIAGCPFRIRITPGGLGAEPSSILPRGTCLANETHSDWVRSLNVQLTQTVCATASDISFLRSISTDNARDTASFRALIRSPSTAFTFQSRPRPKRTHAFAR